MSDHNGNMFPLFYSKFTVIFNLVQNIDAVSRAAAVIKLISNTEAPAQYQEP